MNPTPNPQACYWHGSLAAELAALKTYDLAPHYRQAARDWHQNHRVWRPVTEEIYDHALNAVPPVSMRRGFIAGEAYCHTRADQPVYGCFRHFNGVPHLMLATVHEFFHASFSIHENSHAR